MVFWRILAKNHVDWFWVESEKWPKSCNFEEKVRLYTWYFGEFWPKITWTDFEWRVKSGKNRSIFSKNYSKHLVFWRILAKNHVDWFWVESEKWPKSCNFQQKLRLYTWYFGEFWPKIMWTDFEWRVKSGQNRSIFSKNYSKHLVFWRILAKNHVDWFWVESEKWPKSFNFQQKLRLYTWYFGEFWPKIMWTDFEWRVKSGQNRAIFSKS